MGMMIIRHKVRDYGQWRPIFDANAEMQKAAGACTGNAERLGQLIKILVGSLEAQSSLGKPGL
jgi:hypothetical protein